MFRCRDVVTHSSDYLDGRLSRWDRLHLWLHLLICHHCRRYLRQFRTTIAALAELPPRQERRETNELAARLLQAAQRNHGKQG